MSGQDDPTGWFEPLYRDARDDGEGVPWANMATHPSFARWLGRNTLSGTGQRALVVGCGMGDDAVELARRGFDVTAFDVAPSAIAHCRRRFPDEAVAWEVADLLDPPPDWSGRFDFVLEVYTIQALPPAWEDRAIGSITGFVASGGRLLTIAVVGDAPRTLEAGPPWILTPEHVDRIEATGFRAIDRMTDGGGSKRGDVAVTLFERIA